MSEHTKEPWAVRELLPDGQIIRRKGTYEIYTVDYDVCATLTDGAPIRNKADADRIVACVNACAGINPEAVQGMLKAVEWASKAGHHPNCIRHNPSRSDVNACDCYVGACQAAIKLAKTGA